MAAPVNTTYVVATASVRLTWTGCLWNKTTSAPAATGRIPEHVDHDHATGQVRGMLCSNCNQALGNVRDSVQVLERLAGYLVKHHFLALGATLTESSVENGFIELVGKHHAG
jgi:hypothetical protein